MLKRVIYVILFLSLSGLLLVNRQKVVALYLPNAISLSASQKNIPPSADDIVTIDFRTNTYFFRWANDEQDDCFHLPQQAYAFTKENVFSGLFVQKTLNFFKKQSIHLLNCMWLI
ncbi:hypothetical protein [Emticicia sp. 17c]|uniref:hypothetical protein n=1 Tax=Emticicia sp. 17c TaxID=3127704 RepID=UPI00301E1229